MTREEKEQTGKYVLQMARLLEDGCYQQEMLLKAVRIIDEALEQEPTTKNDLGVDCISREDALMCLTGEFEDKQYEPSELVSIFSKRIKHLPSVTPQEPKTGYWIADVDRWGDVVTTVNGYKCSECGEFNADNDNYCPNCGCAMVEPQESEDKECTKKI